MEEGCNVPRWLRDISSLRNRDTCGDSIIIISVDGKKEKTIVYCPYASTADTLYKRLGINREVGIYTGRNIDDINTEYFNNRKKQTFAEFREGKKSVLFATKAFGMGIDVDDISNVYHYAVTGNLCDYVQEIGRAARKPGIQGKANLCSQ